MIYAPILLPTLCRYEPLVRCIDSLRRNAWADRTDLVIALDYPKKASHREGYEKIRRYLEKTRFPEFRGVQVILRKKNYGAIRNFRDLLDIGFAKYDRCICVFDDLTFSPNFIQYMDEMLERFEGEPDVEAVLGYSYPVAWKAAEGSNAILQNFSGSIWGIGFWREKFLEMSRYLEGGGLVRDFDRAWSDGAFEKMTDWAVKDYVNSVCYGVNRSSFVNQITDIALRIYLAVRGKKYVMPLLSKVRNGGFDGSGAFCERIERRDDAEICSQNYDFDRQPIDESLTFTPRVDPDADLAVNRALLNCFDRVDPAEWKAAMDRAAFYASLSGFRRSQLNLKKLLLRAARRLR